MKALAADGPMGRGDLEVCLRLGGLRLLWQLLAVVPALLASGAGIAGGVGRLPYLTEPREPVPLAHLYRILHALPGSFAPLILPVKIEVVSAAPPVLSRVLRSIEGFLYLRAAESAALG